MGTILDKANILIKTKLDNLDTKQYPNQAFITTDERDGELDENLAIQFAESERQKSKNLFNPQFITQGAYTFSNGSFGTSNTYVTTSQKINVKPNSQIVMSSNVGIDADSGFVFFNNDSYIGYAKGVVTTTVPSNANQVVFNFHGIDITPASITKAQLEYSAVATDWQQYNGEIVHQNDSPVIFAENERQKSKNLFKVNNNVGYSFTLNGVTATINDDYTITLNGTCSWHSYFNMFAGISIGATLSGDYPKLFLDKNKKYTFVLKYISGSYSGVGTDEQIVGAVFRKTDGTAVVTGIDLHISTNGEVLNSTKTGLDYLNNGYFRATNGITYNNYTIGLMICEGTDADFQSWNGAIFHEKQLNKTLESTEKVYAHDASNVINISDSTLTTLQEFCRLFNKNPFAIYRCYKNPDNNPTFYNLIGSPSNSSSYQFIYVKLYSLGISDYSETWCPYRVYEVFAMSSQQVIAHKYLTANNSSNFSQTDWHSML